MDHLHVMAVSGLFVSVLNIQSIPEIQAFLKGNVQYSNNRQLFIPQLDIVVVGKYLCYFKMLVRLNMTNFWAHFFFLEKYFMKKDNILEPYSSIEILLNLK